MQSTRLVHPHPGPMPPYLEHCRFCRRSSWFCLQWKDTGYNTAVMTGVFASHMINNMQYVSLYRKCVGVQICSVKLLENLEEVQYSSPAHFLLQASTIPTMVITMATTIALAPITVRAMCHPSRRGSVQTTQRRRDHITFRMQQQNIFLA